MLVSGMTGREFPQAHLRAVSTSAAHGREHMPSAEIAEADRISRANVPVSFHAAQGNGGSRKLKAALAPSIAAALLLVGFAVQLGDRVSLSRIAVDAHRARMADAAPFADQ